MNCQRAFYFAGSFGIDVKSDIDGKNMLIPGKAYGFETTVDNIGSNSRNLQKNLTFHCLHPPFSFSYRVRG